MNYAECQRKQQKGDDLFMFEETIVTVKENPIQRKVLMIPKFSFDEVNEKYKQNKKDILLLKEELKKKENEKNLLLNDIKNIKQSYEKALINLQVKETFVEGGILKKQYETIIPKMTCKENEKPDLAKAIVDLIKQTKEKEKEI